MGVENGNHRVRHSAPWRYVAEVVKLLEKKDVKYQLTPMGTIIEVPTVSEGLKIIEEAHELMFKLGAKRIRIDDRRDKKVKMEDKVKSVLEKAREG